MTTQEQMEMELEYNQLGKEIIGAYQYLALVGATGQAFEAQRRIEDIEKRREQILDQLTTPAA